MDTQTIAENNSNWIENLALDEINMNESGVVNVNGHLEPNLLLEDSSIKFMNQIKEKFEIYTHQFNEYRGGTQGTSLIKNFKISNTVNDFMLFRNSLRLVVARKSIDLISIGFLTSAGELFPARIQPNSPTQNAPHEIKAHIGAFNNVSWRFQGEVVEPEALVKHYLQEFIRSSAR